MIITVKDVLKKSEDFLAAKKMLTPRLDAELLLAYVLNWSRIDIYTKWETPLLENQKTHYRDLIVRRGQGEPVAYIIGRKDFYRHSFYVNEDVLIPRPDTELLVEEAVKFMNPSKPWCIWDFGCGSGCLGLSLLKEIESTTLHAFDISEKAIDVAKKNAEHLEVSDRVNWHCVNLFEDDCSTYPQPDVIVANPPYICEDDKDLCLFVRKYEPSQALMSPNGTAHLKAWGKKAVEHLPQGGVLLMELGHLQGEEIKSFFESLCLVSSYTSCEILKDMAQKDRAIKIEI